MWTSLKTPENIWYAFCGALLFILIAKEAKVLPITHDEVSTIVFSQQSVFDIVTYADPIPNNHILNTLLLKTSMAIFGDHPFTDRIPNVLFFIPYFICSVYIGKLLFKESWLRICLVLMLNMQPYLLDFYSLTRGYGISVSLQLISIYFLFRRWKYGLRNDLLWSIIFGAIAVFANFTLLNYFLPLGAFLGVDVLMRSKSVKYQSSLMDISILLSVSLVLASLCYLPFTKMMATKQFVYWGSNGFIQDTVLPLLYSLRYGVFYLPWEQNQIGILTLVILSLLLAIGVLLSIKKDNNVFFYRYLALLGIVILYNYIQFVFLAVPFLNARTSLFFIPLVVINVAFALHFIKERYTYSGLMLVLFFSAFSVQHLVRGMNVRTTFEWYYDANTYEVLRDIDYIIKTEHIQTPIKLNCHWIFYPSLNYHLGQLYPGMVDLVPYHKEIQVDTDAMYYYTQSDEVEALSNTFTPIKDYGWRARFLLKRK